VLFLDAYAYTFRLIFRRAHVYMTFRFGTVLIRSKKKVKKVLILVGSLDYFAYIISVIRN